MGNCGVVGGSRMCGGNQTKISSECKAKISEMMVMITRAKESQIDLSGRGESKQDLHLIFNEFGEDVGGEKRLTKLGLRKIFHFVQGKMRPIYDHKAGGEGFFKESIDQITGDERKESFRNTVDRELKLGDYYTAADMKIKGKGWSLHRFERDFKKTLVEFMMDSVEGQIYGDWAYDHLGTTTTMTESVSYN
uniref:Uncharacterized protein n=1 Tax=Lotharella globosa TaxID=91324 RepID=A0A7S3YTV4_9EUKA|eukprot:CAMPEP_0167816758 /NCGR_PEP_ID=MMETSP0112_2-20121227/3801_1 /TAXON_ID=91324 /ORGANISM="Lotharella globosa, Strain CCCM811" /LENGTH=191 /DNA_ID=CAMNT_0007716415 /DNA_START=47 /DNA_END=622 /DNA_ORIENTATION=+